MLKITPEVVEYAWGNNDFIPNLIGKPVDDKPKAEMWMGTHPGAPSTVSESHQTLEKFLEEKFSFL